MTKRPDTTFYYSLPRWDGEGSVVLHTFPTAYPDRSHLRTRTRPALLTCFTCYRALPLGGREFKHRHAYHFWAHYHPVWQRAAPRRLPAHAKETPMDVLGGVFIALVWLAVVGYLAWVGWDALSRLSK